MIEKEIPKCPKCGRPMHYDSSEYKGEYDPDWVCDPCDDAAIEASIAEREWRYYHDT